MAEVVTTFERKKWLEFRKKVESDAEATHLWMRWKCVTDLYFLGSEILGMGKVRRGRKRLLDPKLHRWLCGILSKGESCLIKLPRGHLKTAWIKVRMIQEILKNPGIRQGYFSLTTKLGRSVLKSVTRMLQTPLLMRLWPDVIPKLGKMVKGNPSGWERVTTDVLLLKSGESTEQNNQIEIYGVGSVATGKHFDIHYYDDILNEDTVKNPEMLMATEEWYGYQQGILDPEGYEVVICTPYHFNDLYTTIERERIYDNIYKRSCIEGGKPIYNYYTLGMLAKMKKRMGIAHGNYLWSCQMMCEAVPREDQIFPPPQPTYSVLPKAHYNYYITVDPAATTKKWSDYTAFCVTAINQIGWVYVIDAFEVKQKGEDIARILLELNEKYKPLKIGIELGILEHLRTIIDMTRSNWEASRKQTINLPIEEVKYSLSKSKFERINLTLGSFVRSGKIKINERLLDLMKQMEFMSPNYTGHDDLVDSLSMVFQIAKDFSWKYWEKPLAIVQKDWFTAEEIMNKMKKKSTWREKYAV